MASDGSSTEGMPSISLPGGSGSIGEHGLVPSVDPATLWPTYGFAVKKTLFSDVPVGNGRWTPLPGDHRGTGQFFIRAQRVTDGSGPG